MATAEATREAHIAVNTQKQAEAESDRDLNLKKAEYETQVPCADLSRGRFLFRLRGLGVVQSVPSLVCVQSVVCVCVQVCAVLDLTCVCR